MQPSVVVVPQSQSLVESLLQELYVAIHQLQNMDAVLDSIPDENLKVMFAEDLLQVKREYDITKDHLRRAIHIYNAECIKLDLPANLGYYRVLKNLLFE